MLSILLVKVQNNYSGITINISCSCFFSPQYYVPLFCHRFLCMYRDYLILSNQNVSLHHLTVKKTVKGKNWHVIKSWAPAFLHFSFFFLTIHNVKRKHFKNKHILQKWKSASYQTALALCSFPVTSLPSTDLYHVTADSKVFRLIQNINRYHLHLFLFFPLALV